MPIPPLPELFATARHGEISSAVVAETFSIPASHALALFQLLTKYAGEMRLVLFRNGKRFGSRPLREGWPPNAHLYRYDIVWKSTILQRQNIVSNPELVKRLSKLQPAEEK